MDRKLPFVITPKTIARVIVGDVVVIKFDDRTPESGSCHWCEGNIYQCFVTQTCIPGPNARDAGNRDYSLRILTNAIENDIPNWSQTTFNHAKDDRWKTSFGGNTHCTITVVEHINNLPIKEINMRPPRPPDTLS